MSWITDLAGKAEDLLNQIDQTAATTLVINKSSPGNNGSGRKHLRTGSADAGVASPSYSGGGVLSSISFQNEFETPKSQIGGVADSVQYGKREYK